MILPTQKEIETLNEADKKTLGEFYDNFYQFDWLDKAMIYETDVETMRKTIKINVKYQPVFHQVSISDFAKNHKIAARIMLPFDKDSVRGAEGASVVQAPIGVNEIIGF